IASARAAPRASSRSRHSFPVAECATPRNAGGGSIGNAVAGSVMMLSADKPDRRAFNDSCAPVPTYTRHPRVEAEIRLRDPAARYAMAPVMHIFVNQGTGDGRNEGAAHA